MADAAIHEDTRPSIILGQLSQVGIKQSRFAASPPHPSSIHH
jgi:hypothetical protein